MNSDIKTIVDKFTNSMSTTANNKTSGYNTTAEVRRVDEKNGLVWVHIPGGVDETPIKQSISCKPGDQIQVHVQGGTAYTQGNYTSPPTDDTRANQAYGVASNALDSAVVAKTAADSAVESAEIAKGAAADAQTAADDAQASADNASEYAARALGNLSTVQNITETLNWITAHGQMSPTQDQQLDPTHVYFVVDQAGDYVVGGTHYSVVTEPDVADISTYYELSINESLNNYVATHLAVDSEGLWIIPDAGGNKVLIATGSGSTYTTAGTYIVGKVGGVDTVLASFTASGAQIGIDDNSHVSIKPNGIDFFAKENAPIGTVSTQEPLTRTITSEDYSPYGEQEEEKICYTYITDSVSDNLLRISSSVTRYRIEESSVIIDELPFETGTHTYTVMSGDELFGATLEVYIDNHNRRVTFTFTDTTGANNLVAAHGRVQYTNIYSPVKTVFGKISDQQEYGNYSVALCSSIAKGDNQVTCGKYNDVDENNEYAFIVGGGTDERSRENIFDLDWDGNVWAGGDISAPRGTVSGDKGMFYDSLETSGDINISGQYHYKINGTNLNASHIGLSTTQPTKPSITKTSGNAKASVTGWVAYGNVRMLTIQFSTTASTSAGSDLFNGTITTTAARPKIATSGTSFFGSAATVCYIGSNGAIQVRVIGASIASGKTTNSYLTYIV